MECLPNAVQFWPLSGPLGCAFPVPLSQAALWVTSHSAVVVVLAIVALQIAVGVAGFLLFRNQCGWMFALLVQGRRPPFWRANTRKAERRAKRLLRENLTDGQCRQLTEQGYLEIPSRLHPDRRYRLPRKRRRVQIYEGGQKQAELCLISCDPVPYPDLLLTQKLMIETDEEGYLQVANRLNYVFGR